MTDNTRAINDELRKIIAGDDHLRALFTVQAPRYRFHGSAAGVRYCWNTEPVQERDGQWFAWEYRPVGPGARTGKATRWEMRHRVRCGSRKAAKARALAWYTAETHRSSRS